MDGKPGMDNHEIAYPGVFEQQETRLSLRPLHIDRCHLIDDADYFGGNGYAHFSSLLFQ
jgi:hypothetical protein